MGGIRAGLGALLAATVIVGMAPVAGASTTTLERTIQDCDGDNLLDFAPGEDYVAPESGEVTS